MSAVCPHLCPLLVHLWAVGLQCNYSAQLVECQLGIFDVLQTAVRERGEDREMSGSTEDESQ